MIRKRIKPVILLACSLVIAGGAVGGCSNSANSILTTGSLFGTNKTKTQAAAPVAVKSSDRVIYVAAAAARAQKCGYVFNPVALQTNYLAYEAQRGVLPAELANLKAIYNFTVTKLGRVIGPKEDYCSAARTEKIKGNLTRYLAGDYSVPKSKKVAGGSWLDIGDSPPSREVLNPEWIKNPAEPQTKRVEQ